MLTSQDLKLIRSAIRTEIGNEGKNLKNLLTSEIKMTKIQILTTISTIEDRIKNIEISQEEDIKLLMSLHKSAAKLRKDLTKTIDFFDKSGTETREKLNKTRKDLRLKEVEFAY